MLLSLIILCPKYTACYGGGIDILHVLPVQVEEMQHLHECGFGHGVRVGEVFEPDFGHAQPARGDVMHPLGRPSVRYWCLVVADSFRV